MNITAPMATPLLQQDQASSGVQPRSGAGPAATVGNTLSAASSSQSFMSEFEQSVADIGQAGQVFEGLSQNYKMLIAKLSAERPDVMSQTFDFTTAQDGTLQVSSSTMSADDKTWLQQQLNADGGLVFAAGQFTSLVLKAYDTDYSPTSVSDGSGSPGNASLGQHSTYNYQGLASTIYGSIKFVSLLNQLDGAAKTASAPSPSGTVASDPQPYINAGLAVQQFLQANITDYVQLKEDTWGAFQRAGAVSSGFV
jgi:hypothetical protein